MKEEQSENPIFKDAQIALKRAEPILKKFIKDKELAPLLSDEKNYWNESEDRANTHPDPDNYQFWKKNKDNHPARSVRWQGKDKLYYCMQIYLDDDQKGFTFWSTVSSEPFRFPESRSFQKKDSVGNQLLMMPNVTTHFKEILETNYQLLQQKGAKITATS